MISVRSRHQQQLSPFQEHLQWRSILHTAISSFPWANVRILLSRCQGHMVLRERLHHLNVWCFQPNVLWVMVVCVHLHNQILRNPCAQMASVQVQALAMIRVGNWHLMLGVFWYQKHHMNVRICRKVFMYEESGLLRTRIGTALLAVEGANFNCCLQPTVKERSQAHRKIFPKELLTDSSFFLATLGGLWRLCVCTKWQENWNVQVRHTKMLTYLHLLKFYPDLAGKYPKYTPMFRQLSAIKTDDRSLATRRSWSAHVLVQSPEFEITTAACLTPHIFTVRRLLSKRRTLKHLGVSLLKLTISMEDGMVFFGSLMFATWGCLQYNKQNEGP